ncbi:hypothetical protein HN512_00105 [Candidatus Peregrinibacteria bacterium]|jgi:hypothetical protein|nr:hypothetical protein [Candidatus Peregrinibacteria bacterium]MBT3598231.1 hypothetical protein [Candidatus Peregrinibacteria bacterium]MBT4585366.1 hypothetical protein [Candidatus Peregrinibacteria bacterium]MBT6730980.1 hypothetical protein [Candidatus Peregrinibacteria bacterium]MBT7009877.1 hypothetical protein [Candidatus Peregrinibacteria bacterium]
MTRNKARKHRELSASQGSEAMAALIRDGFGPLEAQALIEDQKLREEVIRKIRSKCVPYGECTEIETARRIMGSNFYGPNECFRLLGQSLFSPHDEKVLQHIPFPPEVLASIKDDYVLVAMPSISVLKIREIIPEFFFNQTEGWFSFEKEKFSRNTFNAQWMLIRRSFSTDHSDRSWDEQIAILDKKKVFVLSASAVAFVCALHYKRTGERLFENFLNCMDRTNEGAVVSVGHGFRDGEGFKLQFAPWEARGNPRTSLAIAIRPDIF